MRVTQLLSFLVPATHRRPRHFPGSAAYWESRYAKGGSSGVGSYGRFAEFKAEVLNRFVATHSVQSVIEFGCGDGNQLALASYPWYLGYDVSATAVARVANNSLASVRHRAARLRTTRFATRIILRSRSRRKRSASASARSFVVGRSAARID